MSDFIEDINRGSRNTVITRINEQFSVNKADKDLKHGTGKHVEDVIVTRGGKRFTRKQTVGRSEKDKPKQKGKTDEKPEGKDKKESGKSGSDHAKNTSDESLSRYLDTGTDDKLRKIAIAELRRRGHTVDDGGKLIKKKDDKNGDGSGKKNEVGSKSKKDGKSKAKKPEPQWYDEIKEKYGLKTLPPKEVDQKDVIIDMSGDVHSHWVMKWKDPKDPSGKKEIRSYTDEFHNRKASVKWSRVIKLPKSFLSDVDTKSKKLIGTKEAKYHEAGLILSIISQTGLRVGSKASKGDTGNEGISTLSVKSVSIVDDTIRLDFIGKSHKRNISVIKDKALAIEMAKQIENKKPDDAVFSVNRDTVMDIFRTSLGYKSYKIKDMRTAKACNLAIENLYGSVPPPPLPENKAEAGKLIASRLKSCFEYVSSNLNNTPAMAKNSYIHPAILTGWIKKVGADILEKSVKDDDSIAEIVIPSIEDIAASVDFPELAEGLNPDDYDTDEDDDNEDYPMPDWMEELIEEYYPEDDEEQDDTETEE